MWKEDHNLRGKKCDYITLSISKIQVKKKASYDTRFSAEKNNMDYLKGMRWGLMFFLLFYIIRLSAMSI